MATTFVLQANEVIKVISDSQLAPDYIVYERKLPQKRFIEILGVMKTWNNLPQINRFLERFVKSRRNCPRLTKLGTFFYSTKSSRFAP